MALDGLGRVVRLDGILPPASIDHFGHVLTAVSDEQFGFFLGRHVVTALRGQRPQTLAIGAMRGLEGGQDRLTPGAQGLGQLGSQGGLAGAIDPFEDNQKTRREPGLVGILRRCHHLHSGFIGFRVQAATAAAGPA